LDLSAWGWSPFFQQRFAELGPPSALPARVIRVDRGAARLVTAEGERFASRRPSTRAPDGLGDDAPKAWAVGDWCAVTRRDDDRVWVEAILPRQSHFVRKAAGRATGQKVVAANIDLVFVVTDLGDDFNVRRLERLLTLVWDGGASPAVVLNKADCCDDPEPLRQEAEAVAMGVPVWVTSALSGQGLDTLGAAATPGSTVAFIGSSGVGKSALINGLLGTERQRTGAIRDRDGRGTHTTTSGELLQLPEGGILVDTPGMREVAMWASEAALDTAFAEIDEAAQDCRFNDCTHDTEPGCAVQRAVEEGTITADRLASFHKLRKELQSEARRRDEHLRRQHERKLYGGYRQTARLKRGAKGDD